MDPERIEHLKAEAQRLRAAGHSRRELKQLLGIRGNDILNDLLRGETPAQWVPRRRARPGDRETARELRRQGLTYRQIAEELSVSLGSCSLWLRDLPRPEGQDERRRAEIAQASRDYWAAENARRDAVRREVKERCALEIGELSDRELLIAGVVAYWAEGAKDKPYARREHVKFTNSDPAMIELFLRWLDLVGVLKEQLGYRLSIHRDADVAAATAFWADLVGVDPSRFDRPTLKRHNPLTVRKNTADSYRGCLVINVRRSASLYQQIEGWFMGVMRGRPKIQQCE